MATDLANGNRVVFRRGNTGQAVRALTAPCRQVFEPVLIQGRNMSMAAWSARCR